LLKHRLNLLGRKFEFTHGIWFQDLGFWAQDHAFIESHDGYKAIYPEGANNADSKLTPGTFMFMPVGDC
jgi:hypothetical protein